MWMADGRHEMLDEEETQPVAVKIDGKITTTRVFTVLPRAKFDVILGRAWLADTQPVLDWRTNEINIGQTVILASV